MVTKIQKWGNSQGIRLSARLLEDASISIGDEVEITVRNGAIVIVSARLARGRPSLRELVLSIPRNFRGSEVDWRKPVGDEEW